MRFERCCPSAVGAPLLKTLATQFEEKVWRSRAQEKMSIAMPGSAMKIPRLSCGRFKSEGELAVEMRPSLMIKLTDHSLRIQGVAECTLIRSEVRLSCFVSLDDGQVQSHRSCL